MYFDVPTSGGFCLLRKLSSIGRVGGFVFGNGRHRHVRVDVFNQPAERFAIETVPKLHLLADITKVPFRVSHSLVIELLVITQPNFSQTIRVPSVAFMTFGELKIWST